MNLSEVSIKHHVFTWMLMFGLIFFGAVAYRSIGISLNPDIDFPVANISVTYAGAAPAVMENNIIEPIESAIVAVPNIKTMTSTARTGQANIAVEFELNQDIDVAIQDLQARISRVQRQLPTNIDPPIVQKSNPEDAPIAYLALQQGKLSTRETMVLIREKIADSLSASPGVSEASLLGFIEPNLRVDLDINKLRQLELTPQDVVDSIKREHIELPAGSIFRNSKEEYLRVRGEVTTPEELKKIMITQRGGSSIYSTITLKDVADISAGTEDPSRISRVNGQKTAVIGVRKQRGSNSVAVVDALQDKIKQINQTLPEGTHLIMTYDTTTFIKDAVHELINTILIAALLTAVVCWIFLGSLGATFNIILAIPTSVIGCFIFLKLFNFTMNSFTLLGLSLAIGIIVDDAIIMLENIFRHREKDKDPIRSAITGSREIAPAIFATTAAVIAIFLPIAFVKGIIGKYMFQFGVTLSIAVILSCVEALTLAPMRISRFGGGPIKRSRLGRLFESAMEHTANRYSQVIGHLLRHRWPYLFAVLGLFTVTLLTIRGVKVELSPTVDEGRAQILLKTPQGSSIDYTDSKTKEVEAELGKLPFIKTMLVNVGGIGGFGRSNQSSLILLFERGKKRSLTLDEVNRTLSETVKRVPGVQAVVRTNFASSIGSTGGSGQPIEFIVTGPDSKVLLEQTQGLIEKLKATGKLVGVSSDTIDQGPQIDIVPDREAALRYRVDADQIANALSTAFSGVESADYTEGNRRYKILVTLKKDEKDSIKKIDNLWVRNDRGQVLPLRQLVKFNELNAPVSLYRYARQQAQLVSSGVAPNFSQNEGVELVKKIAEETLAPGYRIQFTGSTSTFQETSTSILFVMAMGIIVSYMILASQFNSFIDPVTILIALPFSISGALLALWLTGQTINMYSMIGMILLMGIAKKNSILIVEFTNQLREQGEQIHAALQKAGRLRLRPILMTSIATLMGAVPSALNFGSGAETRIPMAVAIIGGVLVSTPLTLFAVPIVYSLFGKFGKTHDQEAEKAHGGAATDLRPVPNAPRME